MYLHDIHTQGIDLNGLWQSLNEAYTLYTSYLQNLSDMRLMALSHILVYIVIYSLLFNIIGLLFGK